MGSFRDNRRPEPDADDLVACSVCDRRFQGKTARRKFASWAVECHSPEQQGCSLKLTYGWAVRVMAERAA